MPPKRKKKSSNNNKHKEMLIGDCIFRPHLVMESKAFEGTGLAGLITSTCFSDIEEWIKKGNVVLDPMSIAKKIVENQHETT